MRQDINMSGNCRDFLTELSRMDSNSRVIANTCNGILEYENVTDVVLATNNRILLFGDCFPSNYIRFIKKHWVVCAPYEVRNLTEILSFICADKPEAMVCVLGNQSDEFGEVGIISRVKIANKDAMRLIVCD